MSELRHWMSEDTTEAESRLLTAARAVRLSPATRASIAATLGVGVGGAMGGVPTAKASLSTLAQLIARKGLVFMALGAFASGAAWVGVSARSPALVVAAPPGNIRTTQPQAASSSETNDAPPEPVEREQQGSSVALSAEHAALRRTLPAASTNSSSSPSYAPSLEDELLLLEAAEAQLDSHQPGKALLQIARYERLHPQGAMIVEAEVIRIEALVEQRQRDQARRAASAFLRDYPNAVQVARIRSLLTEIDANR